MSGVTADASGNLRFGGIAGNVGNPLANLNNSGNLFGLAALCLALAVGYMHIQEKKSAPLDPRPAPVAPAEPACACQSCTKCHGGGARSGAVGDVGQPVSAPARK